MEISVTLKPWQPSESRLGFTFGFTTQRPPGRSHWWAPPGTAWDFANRKGSCYLGRTHGPNFPAIKKNIKQITSRNHTAFPEGNLSLSWYVLITNKSNSIMGAFQCSQGAEIHGIPATNIKQLHQTATSGPEKQKQSVTSWFPPTSLTWEPQKATFGCYKTLVIVPKDWLLRIQVGH